MNFEVDKEWLKKLREGLTFAGDIDTEGDLMTDEDAYSDDYYASFDEALGEEVVEDELTLDQEAEGLDFAEALRQLEEFEDEVECVECGELVEKACCTKDKNGRYVCKECGTKLTEAAEDVDLEDKALDDEIAHLAEIISILDCGDCKSEKEQLQSWLNELKSYREGNEIVAAEKEDDSALTSTITYLKRLATLIDGEEKTEQLQLAGWLKELKDLRKSLEEPDEEEPEFNPEAEAAETVEVEADTAGGTTEVEAAAGELEEAVEPSIDDLYADYEISSENAKAKAHQSSQPIPETDDRFHTHNEGLLDDKPIAEYFDLEYRDDKGSYDGTFIDISKFNIPLVTIELFGTNIDDITLVSNTYNHNFLKSGHYNSLDEFTEELVLAYNTYVADPADPDTYIDVD